MRRLVWALGLCTAAACSRPQAAPPQAVSMSRAAAAAPLRLGVSGDYPPFCEAKTDTGSLAYDGFDLRLVQHLVADLNLATPQPVVFGWAELQERMSAGAMDLAVCGITLRGDRALSMAFTRPYAVSGAVAAVLPSSRARFPSLAALDQPGVRIAVNAGGHLERVARRHFQRAHIVATANNLSLPQILNKAQADAVISDLYESSTWRNVVTYGPFTHDRKAVAVPLDHLALREQINEWLAARENDGWLDARRAQLGDFARLTAQQSCYEALSAVIDLRFSLMPTVAAVKRRDGVSISDPAQEEAVLTRARDDAARLGLSRNAAAALFQVLINLAKEIQMQSADVAPPGLALAQIRSALAAASGSLLPEVQRCARWLQPDDSHAELERLIADDLQGKLPATAAPQITAALVAAATRQ